jgi:hypothetical protein
MLESAEKIPPKRVSGSQFVCTSRVQERASSWVLAGAATALLSAEAVDLC